MASYGCCTGREPPSPDGDPPRILDGLAGHLRKSANAAPQIASWGTASAFSKLEDAAELRAIFEDDRSDTAEEQLNLTAKKSSSSLIAVTSRLRKHFSRDSALSKHRPRSTVGYSYEEIERRKELKLLRDRRIQQELSNEETYDEDARSLSTVATRNSPSRIKDVLTSSQSNLSSYLVSSDAQKPLILPRIIQRRHSFGTLNSSENLTGSIPQQALLTDSLCSSDPSASALPHEESPTIVVPGSRQTLWRLTFASDHRASRLRALSQEYEAVSTAREDIVENYNNSGRLKWFRSQGLGISPLALTKHSGQRTGLEILSSNITPQLATDDQGSVDGSNEVPPNATPLHEMQISKRLTSKGLDSYSSSLQLSSWGSQTHNQGQSSGSGGSQHRSTTQSRRHRFVSSTGMFGSKFRPSSEDILRDENSSFYLSAENSVPQSPQSSKNRLPTVVQEGEESYFRDLHLKLTAEPLLFNPNPSKVDKSTTEPTILTMRQGRRLMIHSSLLASETLSFQEREAELNRMITRFPSSAEKSSPSTPLSSKFKEEFNEPLAIPPAATPNIASLSWNLKAPRIVGLASKSLDGATSFELQVPQSRFGFGFSFSDMSHSSGGVVSPGTKSPGALAPTSPGMDPLHAPESEDETEGIWANALKRTQEEYSERSASKKEKKNNQGSLMAIRTLSWKLKGKKKASMNDLMDEESGSYPTESESELEIGRARQIAKDQKKAEEWSDELDARERQAKAKTVAINKGERPARSSLPPESWTRFPSHTREERTTNANLADKVLSRDFAIKDIKEGVTEWMTGNRKHYHHHHEKEQHHSLPIRVSNQIRNSLYKMRTKKSTVTGDAIHGRKSSVSVGGKLEYPELELLPGEMAGNGLFKEVEREMEAEMRIEERVERMAVFGNGGNDGTLQDKHVGDISQLSIADPRFYDDCISLPLEDDADDAGTSVSSFNTTATVRVHEQYPLDKNIIKKEKYKTWSGRDRAAHQFMDILPLRRSTIDLQMELENMERLERDRVLRAADEAWGNVLQ